ncbi:PaaX family transcriptional regulator [Oleomonas cavernae]|uniref:PaaX family transcriptional regulator n=1 Tax=Oleomonas cavernae TaxID=2320859 RepID=A0A418WE30_9PROT|nr:PaaX family transcriptional regulator C-terminal domain-containing protein [Oleomonas cavernae]RJF88244.1 PaaX family transcriptional regulator [Oleomonas cavernae]
MSAPPKPKNLILELLLAARGAPLSAQDAIQACSLFDIAQSNVRVALVRLSSAGLIEGAGRGSYRLGEQAVELAGDVATWREAEARVRPWAGGYIAVHCAALGRSDRVALRARTRAFHMLGFEELERGLHIRPDSLAGGIEAIRKRLHVLGLEPAANIFLANEFDAAREGRARALWDGQALTASYRQTRQHLKRWLDAAGELEPDVAAREAFLLGSRAIRQVVFDPLLPEPLVDVDERHGFVAAVRQFEQAGRAIWQRFFASRDMTPAAPQPLPVPLAH